MPKRHNLYTPPLEERNVIRLYKVAKILGEPAETLLNAIVEAWLDELTDAVKDATSGTNPVYNFLHDYQKSARRSELREHLAGVGQSLCLGERHLRALPLEHLGG